MLTMKLEKIVKWTSIAARQDSPILQRQLAVSCLNATATRQAKLLDKLYSELEDHPHMEDVIQAIEAELSR
jgi:hypothetical protein